MVFVFRQLQEKCREQNNVLYVAFVDLTKAFDTVSRKRLWMIMERLGCPSKFLSMVIRLHKDQRGQVKLNSDLSGSFPIVNGVKQGCVLAPTLFSIFFSMMLKQVIETLTMMVLYTSATVLTAMCLTSGDCTPTQKHLNSCSMTSSLLTTLSTLKDLCSTWHSLLCRGYPALQTRSQLEEDWGSPPACTSRRIPLVLYHHRKQFTSSLTWGVPPHQTPRSTGKRTTDWQRVCNNKHLKKGTKISDYWAVVLTTLLYGSDHG